MAKKGESQLLQDCTAIITDWQRLVLLDNPPGTISYDTLLSKWGEVWKRIDKATPSLDRDQLGHFVGIGWALRMENGEPQEALRLLNTFFELPNADNVSMDTMVGLKNNIAFNLLVLGREEEGISLYRSLVFHEDASLSREAIRRARNSLSDYCRSHTYASAPSQELTQLVTEIVAHLRRKRGYRTPYVLTPAYASLWNALVEPYKRGQQGLVVTENT
jgi:hypothetical protein